MTGRPWACPSLPVRYPSGLLAVVALDFGELGIDDVLATGTAGLRTRSAATGLRRGGCKQRLTRFFQCLGLGFDLRPVVAFHRGFQFGDRAFSTADDFATDLVAIVLDGAAR